MNVKVSASVFLLDVTPRASSCGRWVVQLDGRNVGLIEKFKDTRTEKNPWKAFAGVGETRFLGASFESRRAALRLLFQNQPEILNELL